MPWREGTSARTGTYAWLGLMLIVGACVWGGLSGLFATDVGGADQSGYVAASRLFAEGRLSDPVRPIPGLETWKLDARAVQPLGMNAAPGRRALVPLYPPGLPLHLVVAGSFLPEPSAIAATLAVLLGASLMLFAAVARMLGLNWIWAGAGMAVLAAQPVFLFMGVQPMSDVPALAWSEAAVFGALCARRDPRWAWMAGVALGVAVAVRPSNLVLLAPLAVAVPSTRSAWTRVLAGGLPWAVGLGWYNALLHGAPWSTGYPGLGNLFSTVWILPSLDNYATWLPRFLSWPVVALVLAFPWVCRHNRLVVSVLTAWVLAFLGFYAPYRHTHETWWYLRFVLPAFPAIILAALFTARHLVGHLPVRGRSVQVLVAAFMLASVAAALAVRPEAREFRAAARAEGRYRRVASWLDANLPPDAVLTGMQMTGALYLYTRRPFLRWDYVFDEDWALVERFATERQVGFYAALLPFEEEEVFTRAWRPLPGRWRQVVRLRDVGIWQYVGARDLANGIRPPP